MNEGRPEPASTARADARDQRPDTEGAAPELAAPEGNAAGTAPEDRTPHPASTTERRGPEAAPETATPGEVVTDEAVTEEATRDDAVSDGRGADKATRDDPVTDDRGTDGVGSDGLGPDGAGPDGVGSDGVGSGEPGYRGDAHALADEARDTDTDSDVLSSARRTTNRDAAKAAPYAASEEAVRRRDQVGEAERVDGERVDGERGDGEREDGEREEAEQGYAPAEADEHTVILPAGGVVRVSRGRAPDDDEKTTILSRGGSEKSDPEGRTTAIPVPASPAVSDTPSSNTPVSGTPVSDTPAPALPDWLSAPRPASAAPPRTPPRTPQQPPPAWAQPGQYPGLGQYPGQGEYPGQGQYPAPGQHPHQAWMPPAWGQAQLPGAPPPGTLPVGTPLPGAQPPGMPSYGGPQPLGVPPYGGQQPPPWQPPAAPSRPDGPKKGGPIGLWIALGVVFALLVGSVLIWFAVSDPPPQQVAAEVADQLDKAEGMRYQGKVSGYTAGEFDIDMTVAKNGDAYGTIGKEGNRAEFAVVGNDTLIKADANWWKSGTNGAKADRLADIWLKNPQDVPTLNSVLKSPSDLAQQFRGGATFWTEEPEQTIDGVDGRTFKSPLIGTVVISDDSPPQLLSYLPSISLYTKTPLKISPPDPAQLANLRTAQSTSAGAKSFSVRLYEQPKLTLSIEPPKLCTTPTCTATVKLANTGDLPASGTIEVRMNGELVQTILFRSTPGTDQSFPATSGNPAAGVGGYRTMYWTARISTN